jgi:hypothetical protein
MLKLYCLWGTVDEEQEESNIFEKSLFEIGFFMSVNKRGTSNLKTPPEVHNNLWDWEDPQYLMMHKWRWNFQMTVFLDLSLSCFSTCIVVSLDSDWWFEAAWGLVWLVVWGIGGTPGKLCGFIGSGAF